MWQEINSRYAPELKPLENELEERDNKHASSSLSTANMPQRELFDFGLRYDGASIGLTLAGPAFATKTTPRPIIVVRDVKPNSQAFALGIHARDVVVAIDGENCEGQGRNVIIGKIKDKLSQNGSITLTVSRPPKDGDNGPSFEDRLKAMGSAPPPTQESLSATEQFWYFSLFKRLVDIERGGSGTDTNVVVLSSTSVWKLLRRASKRTPSEKFRHQGILLKVSQKSKRPLSDLVMDPVVALRCFSEGCKVQASTQTGLKRDLPDFVTWPSFAAIMRCIALAQSGVFTSGIDWLTLDNAREISTWPAESAAKSGERTNILPLAYFVSKFSSSVGDSVQDMLTHPVPPTSKNRRRLRDNGADHQLVSDERGSDGDTPEQHAKSESSAKHPQRIVWFVLKSGCRPGLSLQQKLLPHESRTAFFVESISSDSPLIAAGISVKDELVSIDGEPVDGKSFLDCNAELSDESRERLLLFKTLSPPTSLQPPRQPESPMPFPHADRSAIFSVVFAPRQVLGMYVHGGEPATAARHPGLLEQSERSFTPIRVTGFTRDSHAPTQGVCVNDEFLSINGISVENASLQFIKKLLRQVSRHPREIVFRRPASRDVIEHPAHLSNEDTQLNEVSSAASSARPLPPSLSVFLAEGEEVGVSFDGGQPIGKPGQHSDLRVKQVAESSTAYRLGVDSKCKLVRVNDIVVDGLSRSFTEQLLERLRNKERVLDFVLAPERQSRHRPAVSSSFSSQKQSSNPPPTTSRSHARDNGNVSIHVEANEPIGVEVEGGDSLGNGLFSPIVVTDFDKRSRAAELGVKVGDHLTAVNGEAVQNKSLLFCLRLLSRLQSRTRTLTFSTKPDSSSHKPATTNRKKSTDVPAKKTPTNSVSIVAVIEGGQSMGVYVEGGEPGPDGLFSPIVTSGFGKASTVQEQGIRLGDYLVSVNGISVRHKSMEYCVRILGKMKKQRRVLAFERPRVKQHIRSKDLQRRLSAEYEQVNAGHASSHSSDNSDADSNGTASTVPIEDTSQNDSLETITASVDGGAPIGVYVEGGEPLHDDSSDVSFSPILASGFNARSTVQNQGVCVGDQLVSANGVVLRNRSMEYCVRVLGKMKSQRRELVFERNGQRSDAVGKKSKFTRLLSQDYGGGSNDSTEIAEPKQLPPLNTASNGDQYFVTVGPDSSIGMFVDGGESASDGQYSPIVVSAFAEGSVAPSQGAQVGDYLLSVNGISVDRKSMEYCVRLLGKMKNQIRTLRLRRAQQPVSTLRPQPQRRLSGQTLSDGSEVVVIIPPNSKLGVYVAGGERSFDKQDSSRNYSPLVIDSFPQDSPAEKQGAVIGDELVSINGIVVDNDSLDNCLSVLSSLASKQRILLFRRKEPVSASSPNISRTLVAEFENSNNFDAERSQPVLSDDSDAEYREVGTATVPLVRIVLRTRPNESMGLSLSYRDDDERDLRQLGRLFVDNVDAYSAAERAGVVVGDTLVAINGTSMRTSGLEQLDQELKKLPSNVPSKFEFERLKILSKRDQQREDNVRHSLNSCLPWTDVRVCFVTF